MNRNRVGGEVSVSFEINKSEVLQKGAWGTFIRCTWGKSYTEARWGKRTKEIENSKFYFEIDNSVPVVAYFNAGYENLTLDVDAFVHSEATVRRLGQKFDPDR